MSNIRNAALAALFVVVLGVPSLAMAQAKPESHWYIGGNIGQADIKEANDDDMSYKILGGYQINKHFAAEVAYSNFGKVSQGGTDFKSTAWEAVGVGILPLGDGRFGVFGKAGFFWGEAKGGGTTDDSVEFTYGVGVSFDFTPQLSVRGEWQKYTDVGNGASDVDVLSVGVVYRFK